MFNGYMDGVVGEVYETTQARGVTMIEQDLEERLLLLFADDTVLVALVS